MRAIRLIERVEPVELGVVGRLPRGDRAGARGVRLASGDVDGRHRVALGDGAVGQVESAAAPHLDRRAVRDVAAARQADAFKLEGAALDVEEPRRALPVEGSTSTVADNLHPGVVDEQRRADLMLARRQLDLDGREALDVREHGAQRRRVRRLAEILVRHFSAPLQHFGAEWQEQGRQQRESRPTHDPRGRKRLSPLAARWRGVIGARFVISFCFRPKQPKQASSALSRLRFTGRPNSLNSQRS